MSLTQTQMIALLKEEVKGLTPYLVDDDYENACLDSSRETGWSFPVSDGFQTYWTKQRAKRHIFFYLMSESAHKFHAKAFKLNQRFEHYFSLIKMMDEQFTAIQESNPEEFANGGVEAYAAFGSMVSSGFSYNGVGEETTYDDSNLTEVWPNDNS